MFIFECFFIKLNKKKRVREIESFITYEINKKICNIKKTTTLCFKWFRL